MSAADSVAYLERTRIKLSESLAAASLPPFTVSFGVADTCPDRHLDTLVRIADEARYDAKDHGRDRIEVSGGLDDTNSAAVPGYSPSLREDDAAPSSP